MSAYLLIKGLCNHKKYLDLLQHAAKRGWEFDFYQYISTKNYESHMNNSFTSKTFRELKSEGILRYIPHKGKALETHFYEINPKFRSVVTRVLKDIEREKY